MVSLVEIWINEQPLRIFPFHCDADGDPISSDIEIDFAFFFDYTTFTDYLSYIYA